MNDKPGKNHTCQIPEIRFYMACIPNHAAARCVDADQTDKELADTVEQCTSRLEHVEPQVE